MLVISEDLDEVFARHGAAIEIVVHTAAQPSHDWAARDPFADFSVNANGTLNLLEAMRHVCPEAPLVHLSTNKVYGDTPNSLPLRELEKQLETLHQQSLENNIDMAAELATIEAKIETHGAAPQQARLLPSRQGPGVFEGSFVASRPGSTLVSVSLGQDQESLSLDVRLPDMTGFDVLAKIREDNPVVMMITAYGDAENHKIAKELGADDFLTKPVDFIRLKEKLNLTSA